MFKIKIRQEKLCLINKEANGFGDEMQKTRRQGAPVSSSYYTEELHVYASQGAAYSQGSKWKSTMKQVTAEETRGDLYLSWF